MLFKEFIRTYHPFQTGYRIVICLVFAILCTSGLPFAPGVITQFNFNEGSGSSVADLSGNGHNGTLVNSPAWTTGKYGQALSFNGSSNYVNIPDHNDYTLNPAQSYTWSAWVKNTDFTSWGTVWSQTVDNNNFFYFYAHSTNDAEAGPVTNGVSVYWYNGANRLVVHSNDNVLSASNWSYITVTYNGSLTQSSRFTIYVNGTDVTNRGDVESTGTITTINPTNIRIGSNQPFGDFLNGTVDEVRYYTRLLSGAEIALDMNTPIDNTAPTVSISSPSNGASVNGTINVNANASDNIGVVGVQFMLDGVNFGAEDLSAPYSVSWNTVASTDGNHNLTAKARDLAGNITTSSVVTVNVSNDLILPTISLTSPAPGFITGTIDINASADDNVGIVGVQFLLNGVNLGVEDLTAPYTLSWNSNMVADGQYALSATARDAAGNRTTASVNITVHNNPDTQLPSVSLISPTANSILAGAIDVSATANDNIAVASVEFLLNGVVFGTDLNAPYSIQLNTTAFTDGQFVLTVRAKDIDGNQATTAPINIIIYNNPDTQPPLVNLASPVAGAIVAGTIDINANASDNILVKGVQFLLNGVNLGTEDTVAPYSIPWSTTAVPDGNYILAARARDIGGNTTTTANVIITVRNDAQSPTVTLTSPAAGTISNTINVTADASDNNSVAGVQFLLNGSNLGTEDITTPYSISWNTRTIANGNYTLRARARDASGNIQLSDPVVVTVLNLPPDTQYPVINISSPSAGNVAGIINVGANATDNVGVVGVQFFLNGSDFGVEDLTAPYGFSWNTYSVANGTYTLTAMARDAAGNITTADAVTINVNNISDTELPTVNITAPAAGNVTGAISVKAVASDNIAVAGVQFFLDGSSLGAEDVIAPYAISWNTATATAGNHILSAKARDAAGNMSIIAFVNINVSINFPPLISGVSVNSITANSAIITWTTNVLASSKVNYDATTSYSLSTLTDSATVTSHSMTLTGLSPASLYHYQVVSSDVNGTSFSGDNTFTTASLASTLGTLNQHTVFAYPANKIIPWTPNPADGYGIVMDLAWNYLLNSVPNDPSTGKPAYYSRSYLDPNTQAMVVWPHNPAGLYGMLTESAIKYYGYSGNQAVMQLATNVALWHLDHGMTSITDNWSNVPYASSDVASLTYNGADVGNGNGQGDGDGFIEPDKIGELGNAWLQLYKYGGNTRFRDAAIQAANVLSSKIRTGTVNQSPWPFRVNAITGAIREEYCSNIIPPISLLDNLIAAGLGDTTAYKTARNTAWTWMMNFPMQNNVWAQYFEDVPIQSSYNNNRNQYNAMMVARYLLEHPEYDANWETHARGLITWVETNFGQSSMGATTIREQEEFFYAMGSHTSRYASVNALLFEKTGDLVAKEKAYRAFNWATYMCRSNGVVIDGPDVNNQWFSDGYGDYIRHFMTGLAAAPEWVPFNQTHLLRSSSVIRNINYGINNVSYTTYDSSSVEVLHISFDPVTVMADGIILPRRTNLNAPGWTIDLATKTLRVYHNKGTLLTISSGGTRSICPGETVYFSLPKPGAGYTYQWQVDSTGTGFVNLVNGATYSGAATDTLWLNVPATSCYGNKYRCIATKNSIPLTGPVYELKFTVKWEGGISDEWEDISNWSCNYVPDSRTDVILPAGASHNPVVTTDVSVHSIILSAGSTLTLSNGMKLNITGK
jgi:hypothetical protein